MLAMIRAVSLWLFVAAAWAKVPEVFENIDVIQNIDLTGPFAKLSTKVVVKNVGDEPVRRYYVPVPVDEAANLAAIEAETEAGKALPMVLSEDESHDDPDYLFFFVDLAKEVQPGEKATFSYAAAVLDSVRPYPESAEQSASQMLVYNGTRNVVSAYRSLKQEVNVKTITQKLADLQSGDRASESGAGLGGIAKFGPFKNVAAYSFNPLTIQYENPLPLIYFPKVSREVWVSHWGDAVSFDESYDMYNPGTKLQGEFSRLDYQHASNQKFSLNNAAIRLLRLGIPSPARDTYYVDLVGNVSTSKVLRSDTEAAIEINPRYPVFGGWFYNFTVGWTNNLGQFVHQTGPSRYTVAVPLLNGPKDASYGDVSTKIILPEGAVVHKVYDLYHDTVENGIVFSYLDLQGRPAVELSYSNLVSDHRGGMVLIDYTYTRFAALRKPLTITIGALAVFLVAYIGSRLDFSI